MKKETWRIEEAKSSKQRYREYKRKPKRKTVMIVGVILLVVLSLVGLGVVYYQQDIAEEQVEYNQGDLTIEKVNETQELTEEYIDTEEETEVVEEVVDSNDMTEEEINEIVDGYIDSMNIETKVGQLFFITPEELTGIGIAVQAGETTKSMLKKYGVGGLVFTDQNFEVLDQMKLMVSNVKVYSNYPIFVAMDEDGAVRITNTNNTLEEVGFNIASIESELYLITDEGNESISAELNVVNLEDGTILELVSGDADIIVATDGFESAYNTLVTAVRNGDIEESFIEEKVRKIMTYKVINGI